MARNEEEKLTKAEIEIILGGKSYFVRPLVIKESRKWRAKFSAVLGELPQYTGITTDTPDKFMAAINAMLVGMPDKIVDLVFDYAPELDRKEIEATATDAEMAKAFEQIIEVAFPLARSLVGAMGKLSP
ncbi:MAG: hypothetical protein DDT23_00014 [candidate division WS2 bacterium]|nr:hypothetical protein [Candidatus Lithacetigena glycinireducens]